MVAVKCVVERKAIRKPTVMRPGVLRSRLFPFASYQPVVVNVGDHLEAVNREHSLSDKQHQPRGSIDRKESDRQSER